MYRWTRPKLYCRLSDHYPRLPVRGGTDTRLGQSLRSSFRGSSLGNLCVSEKGRALESGFKSMILELASQEQLDC